MSFILDALKKSEAERQRQLGPALLDMQIARPPRRLPRWAAAVGTVLILSVLVLGWLAWRAVPVRATAAPATAAAAPAIAALSAHAPADAGAAGGSGLAAPPAAVQPPAAAKSNPVPASSAPPAPSASGAASIMPATPVTNDNPADNEPAVAPAAGESSGNGAAAGNLHNYTELSGTLPQLRLDLHVYAANPADRYALINMHMVHEGEVTPEGARVRQITREGVVLEFRGTDFLLGRQ